MTIYYFTLLLVIVTGIFYEAYNNKFAYKERNKGVIFVYIIGFILISVSGFRWFVGTDYWQYSYNYHLYKMFDWSNIDFLDEPGFKILAWISMKIYDDYITLFFLASLITVGLMVRTIYKRSDAFLFSILLYILLGTWHSSFNGVRQAIAVAIIYSAHEFIVDRKFWKYFIIVIIASMFHVSAIIGLFLYFIPQKKLKIKDFLLLFITAGVILYSYNYAFNLIELLTDKNFTDFSYLELKVNRLRILTKFAPLFVYFLLTEKSKLSSKDNFYVNIMFINAIASFALSNSAYLLRLTSYISGFTIIGLAGIINFTNSKQRVFLKIIILFLYFIFWYIEIQASSNLSNYRSIFER